MPAGVQFFRVSFLVIWPVLVALLAWTGDASAQSAAPSPPGAGAASPPPKLEVLLGGQLMVGGNLLTRPDNPPRMVQPFDGGAGGWGGGGGLSLQIRFAEGALGLQTGLLYERNDNLCKISLENLYQTYWRYKVTNRRIPLLAQLLARGGRTHVALGVGVEFVTGLSVDTELDSEDLPVNSKDRFAEGFRATMESDLHLVGALGLSWPIPDATIHLDIRYSYNQSEPDDFEQRVRGGLLSSEGLETRGSHTMDLRFLLGASYRLGVL